MSLVLLGCASRAYQRATETDTIEAYRAFLAGSPEGELAEAARARIEDLEFEEAARLHTPLAYKRFLEAHPQSHHADAARARLEGLRFNAARDRGTGQGWRQFLLDHPNGKHREEAERARAAAELAESGQREDVASIQSAMALQPGDEARARLEEKLDRARFAAALEAGASGLLAYLREQAAGRHREEARVELLRRQVSGLLVSGLEADALVTLDAHPLGAKLPELRERILTTEAATRALRVADVTLQNAEPAFHLRTIEDLARSLQAPDPLDRWQAAEELGHQVSVRAIDPLLEALRSQRNARVRQQAFDSLARVLSSLPSEVREHEVAVRVEALRDRAAAADAQLAVAVLLDLGGARQQSAAEYQRAFEPRIPDPVILRRWTAIRMERRERHSAAVAARQLALWARDQLSQREGASWTVGEGRGICAAAEAARHAHRIVREARAAGGEFSEDLALFEEETGGLLRLVEAKLEDVELALKQREAEVRTCEDAAVGERLAAAEAARLEALEALAKRGDALGRSALERATERDPSERLRARARALIGRD